MSQKCLRSLSHNPTAGTENVLFVFFFDRWFFDTLTMIHISLQYLPESTTCFPRFVKTL